MCIIKGDNRMPRGPLFVLFPFPLDESGTKGELVRATGFEPVSTRGLSSPLCQLATPAILVPLPGFEPGLSSV